MDLDQIMATSRAFMESRALLTAIELDFFSAMKDGADARAVAARTNTSERGAEMLLNALVAMGLATKRDGTFRLSEVTGRFLVGDTPESARSAMLHTVNLWHRWSLLPEAVRKGTRPDEHRAEEQDPESFIAAMHRGGVARAGKIAEKIDIGSRRRMLDVGGGSGAYSIAFAQKSPALAAVILDRPTVVPIAERHIRAAGLADRITTRVGDYLADDFGTGFDLVLFSSIMHINSPEENRDLLAKARRALVPGGVAVISDFVLTPDKTAPRGGALFALNMLVNTPSGNSYSEDEYRAWLGETGFTEIRRIIMEGGADLVVGRRP